MPVHAHATRTVSTVASGLTNVSHLRFDSSGNLFYTRRGAGGTVGRILAGGGTPATFATGFSDPIGIAIDLNTNNIYVAEYTGGSVDKVTPGGVHTTFATGFASPNVIECDAAGNVYVGEIFTQNVYKVTPAGVKSFYGNANLITQSGAGTSRLAGLGFDSNGRLFCGTYGDGTFWAGPFSVSYIPAGGGTGVPIPSTSLPAVDFTLGPCDNLYVAGYHLDRIGVLKASSPYTMTTYVGTGVAGFQDGAFATAKFYQPSGVAFGPDGVLYVADNLNARIRAVFDDEAPCGATPTTGTTWGRLKVLYH